MLKKLFMFKIVSTILLLGNLSGCTVSPLYGEYGQENKLSTLRLTMASSDKDAANLKAYVASKASFSTDQDARFELELAGPIVERIPYSLNREGVRSIEQVSVVIHGIVKDLMTNKTLDTFFVRAQTPVLMVKNHRVNSTQIEIAKNKAIYEAADQIPHRASLSIMFVK